MNILAIVGMVLTCAIGIWKFVGRLKSQERKQAQKAKEILDEGIKNNDPSSITAGFDRMRRIK